MTAGAAEPHEPAGRRRIDANFVHLLMEINSLAIGPLQRMDLIDQLMALYSDGPPDLGEGRDPRPDAPGIAALYASRGLPLPQPSAADRSWARTAVETLADGQDRRNAA